MESGRGPQYRKSLLPWEHRFCETLGISAEEYFEYYELVAQARKEEQGRELVPDIRCEAATTIAVVSLILGVASTAVSLLLAPKPRAPEQRKEGASFQGSDIRGRTKYAPLSEFASVQDLATLGSIVPLVYTRRSSSGHGGVRVESQMMWSRMVNRGTYQELEALLMFSAGEIHVRPEYDGYAFGDSKIDSYPSAKLALWFSPGADKAGGNIPFYVGSAQQYSEGKKDVGNKGVKPFWTDIPKDGTDSKMIFCGVVTPTQNAVFGQYSPIRNGQGWKYPFKYPGKGDGDKDNKKTIYATRTKHVAGYHAGKTTLTRRLKNSNYKLKFHIHDEKADVIWLGDDKSDSTPALPTRKHFQSNNLLKYADDFDKDGIVEDIGGLTEGLNAINQSKETADTTLDVGELFLIGTSIYRCTLRKNVGKGITQGTPYEPGKTGDVFYHLDRESEYHKNFVSSNFYLTKNSNDIYNETHMPIQKVAVGSIGTTRAVDSVTLGLKSTVYKQINSYPNVQEFTGPKQVDGFAKDNAQFQLGTTNSYYGRISLFRMELKAGDGKWFDYCGDTVFAVYGNNPQPSYNQIQIIPSKKTFLQIRFIPVCGNAWIANKFYQTKKVLLLNAKMPYKNIGVRGGFQVRIRGTYDKIEDLYDMSSKLWEYGEDKYEDPSANPNSLLQDFWFYDADTSSHANEPEHQITHINEYVENDKAWYADMKKQYENIAYSGLICQSTKEISQFSNFSAYMEHGISALSLRDGDYKSTANFPDIAYDLLTNRRYGVGEYVGNNSVDKARMFVASKFCYANDLFWDGVISEKINLREFLYTQAAYQLLDFTILGGQFSLFPSVPYNSDFTIDFGAKAGEQNFPISGLFTDGNVRNFRTTFLSSEERQLFIAELKYREETPNGFPETRVTRVRLAEDQGGYARDPVELFDMTQFCTSREQAIKFAKFALRLRQTVDHSIQFETTPDAAHSLKPGDYIRAAVSIQHQEKELGFTDRLKTGSVAPDGTIQFNQGVTDGLFSVYYWKPGMDSVLKGKMHLKDGIVQTAAMRGSLFTVASTKSEARVYKIESISFTEESFVEITASYIQLTKSGRMRILDWSNKDFVIEDNN